MDKICLRVSVLESLVRDLKHHQLDNVCLSVMDADEEMPAALIIKGVNSVRPSIVVDWDELESDPAVAALFSSATTRTSVT